MNLFLRLTRDVNDRLRSFLRYRGDLSRIVEQAITETNLEGVKLIDTPVGRGTTATTAVLNGSAYERLKLAARSRSCSVIVLVNSAIKAWVKERGRVLEQKS